MPYPITYLLCYLAATALVFIIGTPIKAFLKMKKEEKEKRLKEERAERKKTKEKLNANR